MDPVALPKGEEHPVEKDGIIDPLDKLPFRVIHTPVDQGGIVRSEKELMLEKLLDSDSLEKQVDADDILTGLSTTALYRFFLYCGAKWNQTNEKRYHWAMNRIYDEAKGRLSTINSDSISQYVTSLVKKRRMWPIAKRPGELRADVT